MLKKIKVRDEENDMSFCLCQTKNDVSFLQYNGLSFSTNDMSYGHLKKKTKAFLGRVGAREGSFLAKFLPFHSYSHILLFVYVYAQD